MKNITQIQFANRNNRYNTSLKLGKHNTGAWENKKRYEEEKEADRGGYDYEDYNLDGFKKMRQPEMSAAGGMGSKKEDPKDDRKEQKIPYPKYNPKDQGVKRSDYFE